MEPHAKDFSEVRNHLEHKYLKVHDGLWVGPPSKADSISMAAADTLAYSLRRHDLVGYGLRMLRLARAALIYLSLSVHAEELERASERDPDMLVGPALLGTWDDEWKR